MSPSDCSTVADLLPLHAVGDTEVDEALQVEEHVDRCESCRLAVDDYAQLADTTRREFSNVPAMPGGWTVPSPAARRPPTLLAGGLARAALAAALILAGLVVGRWSATPVSGPAAVVEMPATVMPAALAPGRTVPAFAAPAPLSVFSPAARPFLMDVAREAEGSGG